MATAPTEEANMNLKNLIKQRAIFKRQLTSLANYVINNDADIHPTKLRMKLARIEMAFDEFENVQDKIELLEVNQSNERIAIEQLYDDVLATAEGILKHCNSDITAELSPGSTKDDILQLASFDGKLEHWLSFKAQFLALIDNHPTLSATQKLQYLRSALTGKAKELLKSIELTESSYSLVWAYLNQNYDCNRFIVWRHGELLLNTPEIERNSPLSIRLFVNNVRKHLRALQILHEPTKHWDTLVIIALLPKLDHDTRIEFEKGLTSMDIIPTLDTFLNFLLDKARRLEAVERNLQDRS